MIENPNHILLPWARIRILSNYIVPNNSSHTRNSSQLGVVLPPGNISSCLETGFYWAVVATGTSWGLTRDGHDSVYRTAQLTKTIWPEMSGAPSWRHLAIEQWVLMSTGHQNHLEAL